jgi:hypothetical protein
MILSCLWPLYWHFEINLWSHIDYFLVVLTDIDFVVVGANIFIDLKWLFVHWPAGLYRGWWLKRLMNDWFIYSFVLGSNL